MIAELLVNVLSPSFSLCCFCSILFIISANVNSQDAHAIPARRRKLEHNLQGKVVGAPRAPPAPPRQNKKSNFEDLFAGRRDLEGRSG